MSRTNQAEKLITVKQHLSIDVVCGMELIAEQTKHSSVYHDTNYKFCSTNCKQHFDSNPRRYVGDE